MTAARCARSSVSRTPVPNEPGDSPISAARIAAAGESGVQQQDAHVNG